MVGSRFSLKKNLPDYTFLVFILALNLVPWIPFIRNGLVGSQIGYPSFGQDQMHYVARAHAIWQGKSPFSAFTPTNSGLKDGLGNFAEYLFFLPSKLLFVNRIPFADYFYLVLVISSFLSLAACFYFFKFLVGSRTRAASLTLVFIYFSQFIDLSGIHYPTVPIFNRWPTPVLHYLSFFVFLRILLDSKLRYRKLLGAVTFAFGFYLYLYSWQTLAALLTGAILINLAIRNISEVKALIIIALGGIFLAAPAVLGILQLVLSSRSDGLLQFVFRQQESNSPLLDKMSYLLCLIALIAWNQWGRTNHKVPQFISICALGGIIVSNQQVMTGKMLQPGHFHWYFIAPVFFSSALILSFRYLKSKRLNLFCTLLLITVFGINQIQVIPKSQEEARNQISSGLSSSQFESIQGVVFTQETAVLDQLATSYRDGLYWHPFGIYYSGSREIASESVAFSAIWLGAKSPIKFNPLRIHCMDFLFDPCSTARMLLGSETNMDWFQFIAAKSPVEQSLNKPDSYLSKSLRAASKNPNLYFTKVIEDRNIQTFILSEAASQAQEDLLGLNWKLMSSDGKFWIYTRFTS